MTPQPQSTASYDLTGAMMASLAATTAMAVLLGFATLYFYRKQDDQGHNYWAGSWFALAVFAASSNVYLRSGGWPLDQPARIAIGFFTVFAALLQVGWLLVGTYSLAGGSKKASRRLGSIVLVASALIGTVLVFAAGFDQADGVLRHFLRTGVRALISGGALLAAGIWLLNTQSGKPRRIGPSLIVVAFLLTACLHLYQALHSASFLVGSPTAASTFYVMLASSSYMGLPEVFLQVVTGIGMLIWLFEAAQSRLAQAAKMEAVGQLAGGLAHDFNNLLTVIIGRSQLLAEDADSPELRSGLEQILKAADHAASLTRQLLAFSRKQVLEPKVLDLRDIVVGVEGMMRRLIPENIDLTTKLATQVDEVRVDRNQIEQVILNLGINARDAMPGGGKLTIEVLNAELTEAFVIDNVGANAGPHVLLAIHDTGMGMDAETMSRVFEPFFTTKDVTRGTGLGLATVYGIVRLSGGYVRVQSQLGKGTTFEIYLPRKESEPGDVPDDGVVPAPARGRRVARVLVVEDEPAVRELTCHFLVRAGHSVVEAQDCADAIRMCEELAEPVDLLVTDVVMPDMSGPELAKRLTALQPDLKTLFVSGYAGESLHEHIADLPGTPLLAKPFTFEALSREVEEILASAGRAS